MSYVFMVSELVFLMGGDVFSQSHRGFIPTYNISLFKKKGLAAFRDVQGVFCRKCWVQGGLQEPGLEEDFAAAVDTKCSCEQNRKESPFI